MTEPQAVIRRTREALSFAEDVEPSDPDLGPLLLSASSLLNNAGADSMDASSLSEGIAIAERLLTFEDNPVGFTSHAMYNIATGTASLYDCAVSNSCDGTWEDFREKHALPSMRYTHSSTLKSARKFYRAVDRTLSAQSDTRGRSLCNLGNTLDSSARWVEAYDCYVAALAADPTNGNASGNAAILLSALAARNTARPGHIASLYDHYLAHARKHHERVIELAGQSVADRYLNMPLQGVEYHVHAGKSDDVYVRWISENRLPLTVALEGMGSDSDKWDDAHLTSVTSEPGQSRPPDVFSMVNVLKGEYLVARRLAFDSISDLTSGDDRHDSGTYVDTLDGAIYGRSAQALVLAHRSALDLLDKVAVAVNHYLLVGDDPAKVSFKGFWAKRGSDVLRSTLTTKCPESRALLALAELALDVSTDGLYEQASVIRNAGTHRFLIASSVDEVEVGKSTLSRAPVSTLGRSTIESLRVGRAAYLYFLDLIEETEAPRRAAPGRAMVQLRDQAEAPAWESDAIRTP